MAYVSCICHDDVGTEVFVECDTDEETRVEAEKHVKECQVNPGKGELLRIMDHSMGIFTVGWSHENVSEDGKLMCRTYFIPSIRKPG
jgi:hypothetical protein